MKRWVTALVIMAASSSSDALTGNDFLRMAPEDRALWIAGWLEGYEHAKAEMAFGSPSPSKDPKEILQSGICIPPAATPRQAHDMVDKYLTDNPQIRHAEITDIVTVVLEHYWACRAK